MFVPHDKRHRSGAALYGGGAGAAVRRIAGRPPVHAPAASAAANSDRRFDLRCVSFGSPAAIVTSMALIVGLDAATATKASVVGSLLIIALADNLTDSLSVHIYQESERMPQRQALYTTVANFFARAVLSFSFILLFLLLPPAVASIGCVAWGFLLLSGLTCLIAKARGVSAFSEICKHAGVACIVILISTAIGDLIQNVTA